MSQKVRQKVMIKDRADLTACLDELGFTFEEGAGLQTSSRWGVRDTVEIKLTGYKDGRTDRTLEGVGFRRAEDGNYEATGDFYGLKDIHNNSFSEKSLVRDVLTRYILRKVTAQLTQQGFMATENADGTQQEEDGHVKVVFENYGG